MRKLVILTTVVFGLMAFPSVASAQDQGGGVPAVEDYTDCDAYLAAYLEWLTEETAVAPGSVRYGAMLNAALEACTAHFGAGPSPGPTVGDPVNTQNTNNANTNTNNANNVNNVNANNVNTNIPVPTGGRYDYATYPCTGNPDYDPAICSSPPLDEAHARPPLPNWSPADPNDPNAEPHYCETQPRTDYNCWVTDVDEVGNPHNPARFEREFCWLETTTVVEPVFGPHPDHPGDPKYRVIVGKRTVEYENKVCNIHQDNVPE